MRYAALVTAISILILADKSVAQNSEALVGTWERFAQQNRAGRSAPTFIKAFLIFSNDGYYSQTAVRAGRPKTTRPLSQLTLKEMLERFENAEARYGKFSVSADTLSRTTLGSLDPANRGAPPWVQIYRIVGDTLILSSPSASDKTESRFRRMR